MVSVVGRATPFTRTATVSYHTAAAVSIALPSTLDTPGITRLAAPYFRFSAAFGNVSAEFNRSIAVVVSDGVGRIDLSTTVAASGLSNVSLVVPDFTGVDGWSNAFASISGTTVTAVATAAGGDTSALCSEGARTVLSTLTFQF